MVGIAVELLADLLGARDGAALVVGRRSGRRRLGFRVPLLDSAVTGTPTATRNLRAVQLLLGHTKLESTVRYLGIEVDDALEIAEQTEV